MLLPPPDKFEVMKRYRHQDTLDIDILVKKVMGRHFEGETLLIRYYNRHYGIFQGNLEIVEVKKENFDKWGEIE